MQRWQLLQPATSPPPSAGAPPLDNTLNQTVSLALLRDQIGSAQSHTDEAIAIAPSLPEQRAIFNLAHGLGVLVSENYSWHTHADSEFLEPVEATADPSISRSGDPSATIDIEDMEEEEIGTARFFFKAGKQASLTIISHDLNFA